MSQCQGVPHESILRTIRNSLALVALESTRTKARALLETFGSVPLFFFVAFTRERGVGLGSVTVAWLIILGVLYPACGWLAALKRRRRAGWLFYV